VSPDIAVPVSSEKLRMLVLNIPCEACQAEAGENCRVTLATEIGASFHMERVAPVWVIYRIGYQHGRRMMKKEIERGSTSGAV
jgi:hypothetical protein